MNENAVNNEVIEVATKVGLGEAVVIGLAIIGAGASVYGAFKGSKKVITKIKDGKAAKLEIVEKQDSEKTE